MNKARWFLLGLLALSWVRAQSSLGNQGRQDFFPSERQEDGRPPGPDGMPVEANLTEAQEKELFDFLKTNSPGDYERISKARERREGWYRHRLWELWSVFKDPDSRARFVKLMKAHAQVRELAQKYRLANEKDKPEIKEKLGLAITEVFDLELARREADIKTMESQVEKLKKMVAKRREQKDQHVARRLDRITGEDDDWGW